jgi:hypothetical protein
VAGSGSTIKPGFGLPPSLVIAALVSAVVNRPLKVRQSPYSTAIHALRAAAADGDLMSYGVVLPELFQQAVPRNL